MANEAFRQEQWEHRYDDHIAPINRFVDDLRSSPDRGWLPYVAPMYGGVNARLLSVLRDPGPKTRSDQGSGFLCMENDDPTAEAIAGCFSEAGIEASDIVPWNAYPWYINRNPTALELQDGIEPLKRVIDMLPRLEIVMLHGGAAKSAWKRFERRFPGIVKERKLHVIKTYHTSRKAFWHADPAVREARKENLRQSFWMLRVT
jgi:hypothetical protein